MTLPWPEVIGFLAPREGDWTLVSTPEPSGCSFGRPPFTPGELLPSMPLRLLHPETEITKAAATNACMVSLLGTPTILKVVDTTL